MNTLEILVGMRELLAVPERWTKGLSATDASGNNALVRGSNAVSFCLLGAYQRVSDDTHDGDWYYRIAQATGYDGERDECGGILADWNDAPERTHAEVLHAIDRAIEIERAAA